uniref:RNase H type-1 domain-containing protein n=1 Tax=Eutreptiella gymnastica TaxID=73025 RepID=A0A7S1NPN4_9EUGL|mmetsp:Transcript_68762/g.121476  ORF Transcript_68762/g.121476 Transcript_68762/m.121476 type:complete len:105 (+) Transcript_68762:12-326(+)
MWIVDFGLFANKWNRQIVSTAELFAAIQALGSTDSAEVAICTDSSYVYGGAAGSARRWKVRGWKNTKGAVVPNTALRDALMDEVDRQGRVVEWVKIPSGVKGNA